MVYIENLSKNFGALQALSNIHLHIKPKQLFGLIGPDGAGKSTLFEILATLRLPSSGKATIHGFDLQSKAKQIRKTIGFMPGQFSLYPDLSILENIQFFAHVYGVHFDESSPLTRDIWQHIAPFKHRPAGKLSGGMKQKLALCCALAHRPTLLLLDEPTTGVDPVSRKEFWEMLQSLKLHNITTLVSTPYMDEAQLCECIALIQNGKILAVNSPSGIQAQFKFHLFGVQSAHANTLLKPLRQFEKTQHCFAFGKTLHLTVKDASVSENDIVEYLKTQGHEHVEVWRMQAGIEDCFIELMHSENHERS
ncbi:MAG: ABC transporter ATP-binding protein [Cystobacterineae bacterium]|nr:ABC transporter ATP-binding protein [Cystobacterineae bacterium]